MKEEKVTTMNMDAVLADDELVKKLAAKVLDIIQQKPDSGVVCQGYYCDMAKKMPIKELWVKKLNTLDMQIEEELAESAAEAYPLSADELDQVVTEIKTSDVSTEKLSNEDLSRAVVKVLADNEMMRRKGNMEVKKLDYRFLCSSGVRHDEYLRVPEICPGLHSLEVIDTKGMIINPAVFNRLVETTVTKAVSEVLHQVGALSRTI